MCTNRNISVNSQNSPCRKLGRVDVSCESPAYCLASSPYSKAKLGLPTPDNIANSPPAHSGRINIEIPKISETRHIARLLSTRDCAFFLDGPAKNRYYRLVTRMWRNWQTHRLQVPAGLCPWRFDSSHPHYLARPPAGFPNQLRT